MKGVLQEIYTPVSNKNIGRIKSPLDSLHNEGKMIEGGEVRLQGCICEPCSDISR